MTGKVIQRTAYRIEDSTKGSPDNKWKEQLGDLYDDDEDESYEEEVTVETELKFEERQTEMVVNHCFWPFANAKSLPKGFQSMPLGDCYIETCSRYEKMEV